MPPKPTCVFAPFRLGPAERSLTADGMPLELGGRAFDTLLALGRAIGAHAAGDGQAGDQRGDEGEEGGSRSGSHGGRRRQ